MATDVTYYSYISRCLFTSRPANSDLEHLGETNYIYYNPISRSLNSLNVKYWPCSSFLSLFPSRVVRVAAKSFKEVFRLICSWGLFEHERPLFEAIHNGLINKPRRKPRMASMSSEEDQNQRDNDSEIVVQKQALVASMPSHSGSGEIKACHAQKLRVKC